MRPLNELFKILLHETKYVRVKSMYRICFAINDMDATADEKKQLRKQVLADVKTVRKKEKLPTSGSTGGTQAFPWSFNQRVEYLKQKAQ